MKQYKSLKEYVMEEVARVYPPAVYQILTCQHDTTFIVRNVDSAGRFYYQKKCRTCLKNIKMIKKQVALRLGYVDVDEPWIGSVERYTAYAWQAYRETKQDAWWPWYQGYLNSPQWQFKRAKVLSRDKNRCQHCLLFYPDYELNVHHFHYRNVGDESLEDLTTLCVTCHSIEHGEKV